MLRSFTFGCGQGATKAMIHCINSGVLDKKYCCVVNSTTKDIPLDYQNRAIVISDDPDAGCGKVRSAAKSLMVSYIKKNPNVIDELISEEIDYVNIMATTEGASGSGASVVLAQYIRQQIDVPVIITLITGFESDMRGLQNTIEYFRDIEGDFVVNTISNKRFLEASGNNTFAAEKAANEYIAKIISIINSNGIEDSDQNIDDTDHYKVITNPGMMFVNDAVIDKRLKNPSQFDQIVSDAIDYSASLDFTPSATKIGVYMNISDDNLGIIDTSFAMIKKKLCVNNCVPEFFLHRQNTNGPEFVRIIATGMNMPRQELEDMYKKFQDNKVATAKNDDFFSMLSGMDTSTEDNSAVQKETPKGKFFDQYTNETPDTREESVVLGRNRRRRRVSTSTESTNETPKVSKFSTGSIRQEKPYNEDNMSKF